MIHHKEIGSVHSRLPEDLRLYRRADLRSHSTASKPPELAAPGAYAAGPSSRPPSLGKLARRPGESGITLSQHGCKVSRHPFDSGKDRPAWLGWPPVGPIQKYLSAAPVDVSTANISSRVLASGAVARIGCVCIAVLSVSDSLELRRRRIKSAIYRMKGSERFKQRIQTYLEELSEVDERFAAKFWNPKKNIDDCITYILNCVRQSELRALTMMRSSVWRFTISTRRTSTSANPCSAMFASIMSSN